MALQIIKFIMKVVFDWVTEPKEFVDAFHWPKFIFYTLGEVVTLPVIFSGIYFYINFMKLKR